ncbi:hypothetical protein BHQ17_26475 [Mycolicibacterium holsaticum]|uniref:Uncharacterized protein n=1 Tax=Mycolicibacterium holsaticum TaxID=152142 RepID=A0A1E3R412_9MYCO|nr:hypothetical protein BHQ17_26475 [Mycolicibacterium holsaticum]
MRSDNQSVCKRTAGWVPLVRQFGEARSKYRFQIYEILPASTEVGCRRVEMTTDDDGRVGVREDLRSGQQVVGRRGQRVLVGPTVQRIAHQLFGCRIGDRADGHVGRGDAARIVERAGDPKVGKKDLGIACL